MTDSGLALLTEALDFLAALQIDVMLAPVDGCWRLVIDGNPVTTGDLTARAIALGMFGGSGAVQ